MQTRTMRALWAVLLALGCAACGDDPQPSDGATSNNGNNNGAQGDEDAGDEGGDVAHEDGDVAHEDGDAAHEDGDAAHEEDPATDAGPGECVSHEAFFEERLWGQLFSTSCALCHAPDGLASQTRLVLRGPQEPGWVASNLESLRTVSEAEEGGTPLLLLKPTGRHPGGHAGGAVLRLDSAEYGALVELVGRLRGDLDECGRGEDGTRPEEPTDCEALEVGPRALRRLSHAEYKNTVRDLLGVTLDTQGLFAPDNVVKGFDNNARALWVSPLLADQYRDAAERVGQEARLEGVVPCEVSQGTGACARAFLQRFGLRAMRRPMTDEEQARYLGLYTEVAREDGFEAGLRWMITALLQSPHFLYRSELGRAEEDGGYRLTSWEMAAQLSYLLWETTPDEALLRVAASGELYDPEVLEAQARRLLDDPRSEAVVWRFTERWLGLERLMQVTRDATLYPELTEAVRQDMLKETAKLVGGVWREGGSLEDLLRADHSHMSDALARYYGLTPGQGPADADGFREVGLDTQTGLLTHGSLLTTHSLPTSSSPIHRGKLIRERFLCQELPPPPANLDTSPPPVDPSLSTRERYAQHASDPACRACHELVDPIGFAFERYDAVGRWRERDGVHEIDELGEIIRSAHTDGPFVGVGGLAELLGGSQDVSECYAELWVRFGYGVDQELALGCYAKNLGGRVEASGGKLQEALLGLTQTPHFLRRAGTLGELDVPGAELLPAPGELVDPDLFLDPPAGPGPDPEDPPDDPTPPSDEGVSVRVQEQSRWSSGYCADVFVTNVSEETLAWRASVMVEGRLNNVWNAQASAQEGLVRFEGVEWNRTIAPDQTAQFGFCAQF